jgi:hypothetical protein
LKLKLPKTSGVVELRLSRIENNFWAMPHRLRSPKSPVRPAALFVDYEELYELAAQNISADTPADQYLSDLLYNLRRYLLRRRRWRVVYARVYGDFEALPEGLFIQRSLAEQGLVPYFTPRLDRLSTKLQLCVDALSTLNSQPEIQAFIVVSGRTAYLPLLEHLRTRGRQVALLQLLSPEDQVQERLGERALLDPHMLMDHISNRRLLPRLKEGSEGQAAATPTFHSLADDPIALQTLALIEEHFGRYDAVYLTPLLRKMSETFAPDIDPKEVINRLEVAGAVHLERRRGFPYDYTVLIVEAAHPDVQRIRNEASANVTHAETLNTQTSSIS